MKEILEILDSLPITRGADSKCLREAADVSSPEFVMIDRGAIILSPGQIEDALYVLCDGSAVAYSADEDKQVLLRTFGPCTRQPDAKRSRSGVQHHPLRTER